MKMQSLSGETTNLLENDKTKGGKIGRERENTARRSDHRLWTKGRDWLLLAERWPVGRRFVQSMKKFP